MKPIKFKESNFTYRPPHGSKNVMPLPCFRASNTDEGFVVSCWKLSWKERLMVLLTGKVWVCQLSFNKALQPISLLKSRWDILEKEYFKKDKENKKAPEDFVI